MFRSTWRVALLPRTHRGFYPEPTGVSSAAASEGQQLNRVRYFTVGLKAKELAAQDVMLPQGLTASL